ncbi:MAG: LysR family transcriptional regulator [Pseudomonas sp.]|uniref:LysR family transcriptional regulator n=1 Tax=Pseudomonas abieticivorans TaxID=2931382 RepID=UPI0020BDA98E|nr:LysR family transcriptional regulator [Pseudomonas sp. PIA16]MDE1168071.1 LysR family transcriptional regulator [Pseudomonas sp.]
MDVFQAMQVFVRVVETGSMTAAGEASGLSTTMVGNHLRALEQRLGASLLRRTTRRQSLTEFGHAYYQRCLDILGQVSAAEQLAEQVQAVPHGTLRITAPPTFGAESLMPALADYLAAHPAVKLDVVLTDRVVDLVEEGFDAAIRLGTLENSSLIARPLVDYGLTICASPGYLQRCGQPATPQALADHDCLSFSYPAGTEWRWTEKQWRLRGSDGEEVTVDISGRIAVNSAPALKRAALSGLGIAMLPDALVREELAEGKLQALLTDHRLPVRPMHLVYVQERYRSPKLRSFVEYVVRVMG